MTTEVSEEHGPSALDTVKLLITLGCIVGGLVAYYLLPQLPLPVRVLFVLGGVIVGGLIGMTTHKGQVLWRFIQGSRVEIRKVVWPTRQETTQITIAVFIFTLLMGLFFWAIDSGLLWVTQLATGQA